MQANREMKRTVVMKMQMTIEIKMDRIMLTCGEKMRQMDHVPTLAVEEEDDDDVACGGGVDRADAVLEAETAAAAGSDERRYGLVTDDDEDEADEADEAEAGRGVVVAPRLWRPLPNVPTLRLALLPPRALKLALLHGVEPLPPPLPRALRLPAE